MTRPYRPSNGSEGEYFIEHWCGNCLRDEAYRNGTGDSCPIVADTLIFQVDDAAYPKEWVEKNGEPPICTAFIPVGDDPELDAARADTRQLKLFDFEGI